MKQNQIGLICIFCSTKRNYVLTCEGNTLWFPLIKVRKKTATKLLHPEECEWATIQLRLAGARESENIMLSFLRIGQNHSQRGWIQLEMFVSFVKQCHMAGDSVSTLWGLLCCEQ